MKRKIERNLLRVSGIWDIGIGLVTMFGYYPWFEERGISSFQNLDNYDYLSSSLVGMISKVVLIIALATILVGGLSLIIAKNMKHNRIDKGIMRWIFACIIIHLLIYDVIGLVLYLVSFVIYISRNKAIKMVESKTV